MFEGGRDDYEVRYLPAVLLQLMPLLSMSMSQHLHCDQAQTKRYRAEGLGKIRGTGSRDASISILAGVGGQGLMLGSVGKHAV